MSKPVQKEETVQKETTQARPLVAGKDQLLVVIKRPRNMGRHNAKIICTAVRRDNGPLVAEFDKPFLVGFPKEYTLLQQDMPNALIEKYEEQTPL